MKVISFLTIAFCSLASCGAQSTKDNQDIHAGSEKSKKIMKESPYELHGILDPGMNNMVAFALQTPTAWKMQQSFTRAWNGSTPINQVYIKIVSPDQSSFIEFIPSTPYYYADGPTTRSLRQTAASYGMQQRNNPGEMSPIPPLEYLKKVFIPQLAQRGLQLQVTGEKAFPAKQLSVTKQNYTAYVDGRAAGKNVRIDCMLHLNTTNLNGEVYYNWEVYPSVIMTNNDVNKLYEYVAHARNTFIANPAWVQKNNQLVRNGNMANAEINKRNYDMQRDYYNHVQKKGQEIADARNNSMDKRNESFRDVIGGQAKFEDPGTGDRIKLADKYNHVYKDLQGNYHGSDNSINEAEFNWTELQRLETKDY